MDKLFRWKSCKPQEYVSIYKHLSNTASIKQLLIFASHYAKRHHRELLWALLRRILL